MKFQHLELEILVRDTIHSIGTDDNPINLVSMIITCTKPQGHHLPGAETRNYIDTDRSSNFSYPALESILTYNSLEDYVTAYLNSMTDNKEWKRLIGQSKQLTLF